MYVHVKKDRGARGGAGLLGRAPFLDSSRLCSCLDGLQPYGLEQVFGSRRGVRLETHGHPQPAAARWLGTCRRVHVAGH